MNLRAALLAPLLLAAPAAAQAPAQPATSEQVVGERTWRRVELSGSFDGADARAAVWIYEPPGLPLERPLLLGLPGWKFEAMTWEHHAAVGALADRYGFALALADMNTTIYESAFYPETVAGFRWCGPDCPAPGLRWVGEVVLPWLASRYTVAGAFGLSTGGRGAVLLAQAYPGVPRACSISGTFDLFALAEADGEYKIHEVIYGPRAAHPERWRADDSLTRVAEVGDTALLLIHGGADPAVAPAQSRTLAEAVTARGGSASALVIEGGGHDWALWSGQIEACFRFFTD